MVLFADGDIDLTSQLRIPSGVEAMARQRLISLNAIGNLNAQPTAADADPRVRVYLASMTIARCVLQSITDLLIHDITRNLVTGWRDI